MLVIWDHHRPHYDIIVMHYVFFMGSLMQNCVILDHVTCYLPCVSMRVGPFWQDTIDISALCLPMIYKNCMEFWWNKWFQFQLFFMFVTVTLKQKCYFHQILICMLQLPGECFQVLKLFEYVMMFGIHTVFTIFISFQKLNSKPPYN